MRRQFVILNRRFASTQKDQDVIDYRVDVLSLKIARYISVVTYHLQYGESIMGNEWRCFRKVRLSKNPEAN